MISPYRFRSFIAGAAMIVMLAGCSPELSDRLETLNMNVAVNTPQKLVLTAPGERLVLFNNSTAAVVNGIPVLLHDPAVRSGEKYWDLPENSLNGILLPVLTPVKLKISTILIDPGHGGHDAGAAAVNGCKEKNLNLELARQIAAALQQCGYSVHMTRNSDCFLTLDERADLAAKLNADLFISVHHNASATNPKASGMETFALKALESGEIRRTAHSLRLAYLVQKEQSGINNSPGRGVKTARFKVLRKTPCPAILIEAGFLTNAADAVRCADREFQQKLALAVARAIRSCTAVPVKVAADR